MIYLPWIEKYRPNLLKDIVGNERAIGRFQYFAKEGNIPNVILSGPPGIGKTSTIQCLAHEMLGDQYKEAILELNASNDRGIDVVRNKIKMFAQKKLSLPPGKHKIIVLDEADSMTEGAQQALRRTMEIFSETTRFAFACNTSEKIIEPIQSRCVVVRFTKLRDEQILAKLLEVCKNEDLSYTEDGLEAIIYTAQGDLRLALNNLQSTFSGFNHVNATNVFKVCDEPHPIQIKAMLEHCVNGDFIAARTIMTDKLWKAGFSPEDIIGSIFKVAKNGFGPQKEFSDVARLEFIKEISLMQMRVCEGINTSLQFTALISRLCSIAKNPPEF